MVRWRFGAWEALDDALGLLYAHGLIDIVPVGEPPAKVDRWDYYLLPAGRDMAAELRTVAADLAWYDERAVVVLAVAGQSSGSQLKALQYAQAEYERTVWKASISGITDRVRERLAPGRCPARSTPSMTSAAAVRSSPAPRGTTSPR